jgi:hypothetical protein
MKVQQEIDQLRVKLDDDQWTPTRDNMRLVLQVFDSMRSELGRQATRAADLEIELSAIKPDGKPSIDITLQQATLSRGLAEALEEINRWKSRCDILVTGIRVWTDRVSELEKAAAAASAGVDKTSAASAGA